MTPHPEGMFTSWPLAHLVELAAAGADSDGVRAGAQYRSTTGRQT
ncbi:hypothetical protein [Streptomyces purpureus]|nr:hypothetical protein [Streptomyces purpureus]